MSLLSDTAAALGGCCLDGLDGRALTQGQLGLRAVPKFPESILPLAAHLAVASCSHTTTSSSAGLCSSAKSASRAPLTLP